MASHRRSGSPRTERIVDSVAEPWLSMVGDVEQSFGIADTQQFVVRIEVPATAAAGGVRFRLDMVDVESPDAPDPVIP